MKFAKRYVSKKPSHALPTVTQLIPNAFPLVFEMNSLAVIVSIDQI